MQSQAWTAGRISTAEGWLGQDAADSARGAAPAAELDYNPLLLALCPVGQEILAPSLF